VLHQSHLLQYAELAEGEREGWAKEQGADSALAKIITTGFKAIHLIYFFTAGADEVKCWQIRKGSKAPQVGRVDRCCVCSVFDVHAFAAGNAGVLTIGSL
jgi:ribosome-binding ATPase YchF (GTP1/OBG family)